MAEGKVAKLITYQTSGRISYGAQETKSVDMSSTGIKYVDWSVLANPSVPDNCRFLFWHFQTSSYRFVVLGIGGSDRLYYYVGATHTTTLDIKATPIYISLS